jgi:hypothetical protein
MLDTLLEKVNEINIQRNDLNKKLFNTIEQEIVSVLDKYPEFIAIRWIQYVPSYNDVEACIFTLHEPKYVSSTELSDEEAKAENYTVEIADRVYRIVDVESKSTWDSKLRLLNISNVLYNIEDLLAEQFGENAEVIITRDEIIVNGYDCGY